MNDLVLIDYGMGNLLSVRRALEVLGAKVKVTDSPEDVDRSSGLILPGVGAFKDGMMELEKRGFVHALKKYCSENRPFLGICLGMQMMFDKSYEFGLTEGLGLIPGEVLPLPEKGENGESLKIPHVGWNELTMPKAEAPWKGTILDSVSPSTAVYFVHSFYAKPALPGCCIAECDYKGFRFPAVVRSGNLYGCQFHPEKSGPSGLSILKAFLSRSGHSPH